jgi:hypothetical protein
MNSFHKGEWGKEERKSNPLKKGEPFDIRVRAHDTKFQAGVASEFLKIGPLIGDHERQGVKGV